MGVISEESILLTTINYRGKTEFSCMTLFRFYSLTLIKLTHWLYRQSTTSM